MYYIFPVKVNGEDILKYVFPIEDPSFKENVDKGVKIYEYRLYY